MRHGDEVLPWALLPRLRAYQFRISMSGKGNPYDNAAAESFTKALKTEEVNKRKREKSQKVISIGNLCNLINILPPTNRRKYGNGIAVIKFRFEAVQVKNMLPVFQD
jgi:transposase InsO family protein